MTSLRDLLLALRELDVGPEEVKILPEMHRHVIKQAHRILQEEEHQDNMEDSSGGFFEE